MNASVSPTTAITSGEPQSMRTLLKRIALIPGKLDRPVSGLSDDSRTVQTGDLFMARGGRNTHAAEYLQQAIDHGATAVLVDIDGPVVRHTMNFGTPVIGVPGLALEIGTIASRFHGEPSTQMQMVGITGTNGKTSVAQLLGHVLDGLDGAHCGEIGTLGWGIHGQLQPGSHTTPGPLELQAQLATLLQQGCERVVMEVSSHALDQYRADAVAFNVAVFTNLSHEHLDYHGDLGSYGKVKRRLFMFPGLKFAVINSDDEFGRRLLQNPPGQAQTISYGLDHQHRPLVSGSNLHLQQHGLRMDINTPWGKGQLRSPLLGRFNALNLLAAIATLGCLNIPLATAIERLAEVDSIAGRMQLVNAGEAGPQVVVDYAHTPDALQQALQALREHCSGQLWCVFGCGGERDQAKRPVMGDIAERFADRVVVTWDNPRNEEPGNIIGQILGGMDQPSAVQVERERGDAIEFAINNAQPEDLVLIAGKGHEDYQLVGNQRLAFSDRDTARAALARIAEARA